MARRDSDTVRKLRRLGCDVEHTRTNHLKVTLPNGAHYWTGTTPSDWRAERNLFAGLRRLGLDVTR